MSATAAHDELTMAMTLAAFDYTLMTASEISLLRKQLILTVVSSSDGAIQQSDVADVLFSAGQARKSRRLAGEAAATVATLVFVEAVPAAEVLATMETLNVAIYAGKVSVPVTVQGQPRLITVVLPTRAGGGVTAPTTAVTSTLARTDVSIAPDAAAGTGTVLENAAGGDHASSSKGDDDSTATTALVVACLVLLSVAILVVGAVVHHKQHRQRAEKVEDATSAPGRDLDLECSPHADPTYDTSDGAGAVAFIDQDEPAFTFATAVPARWLGGATTDATTEDFEYADATAEEFEYADTLDAVLPRRRSRDADADACLRALAEASIRGNEQIRSSVADSDDVVSGTSTRSASARSGSSAGSFEANTYRLSMHTGGLVRVHSVKRANPLYAVGEEPEDTRDTCVVDASTSTL